MNSPTLTDYTQRVPAAGALSGGTRLPERPLLSVVTAVLNRKDSLQRTIDSVAGQSFRSVEHVIVDGGSTDGTLDVIRANEKRLAIWSSEPDGGIFDAMNRGVAASRGEYIAILNSDDFYAPDALESVAATIAATNCDVAYGDYMFVVQDIGMEKAITASTELRLGMTIGHAIFIARRVYERLGLYDTRFRYSADLDFALRMLHGGVKFAKVLDGRVLQYFSSGGAAELHLWRASREAASILNAHAGFYHGTVYGLKGLKRVLLRGTQNLNRRIFGEQSYLRAKERYYSAAGYRKVSRP